MKADIQFDDAAVRHALNGLIALGKDLSPAMKEIAGALESGVQDAFRLQQDPADGSAWPDLSETTKARREKRRKWPGPTLRVMGHGLSPRVRGNLVLLCHNARRARRGARPCGAGAQRHGRAVSPIPRRESTLVPRRAQFILGRPPRRPARSIPACAGEPGAARQAHPAHP